MNISKSSTLSIAAAVVGASCCAVPLLFALLGLGSLGLGSFLGKYHWYLTGAGLLLIIAAWAVYFRERKECSIEGVPYQVNRATGSILGAATIIILLFVTMNVFGILRSNKTLHSAQNDTTSSTMVIPVEGMVCVTCEILVEEALTKLNGVVSAQASERHGNVVVQYISEKVTIAQMGEAIKSSGYRAILAETVPQELPAASATPTSESIP